MQMVSCNSEIASLKVIPKVVIKMKSLKFLEISVITLFSRFEFSCFEVFVDDIINLQALNHLCQHSNFVVFLALALGNALLTSFIYTLKLENCGLSGRPILCLCKFVESS